MKTEERKFTVVMSLPDDMVASGRIRRPDDDEIEELVDEIERTHSIVCFTDKQRKVATKTLLEFHCFVPGYKKEYMESIKRHVNDRITHFRMDLLEQ